MTEDSANRRTAYEQAVEDFRRRWGFDPTGTIDQVIADGDYDLEGGTEEERAFIRDLLSGKLAKGGADG